MSSRLPPNHVPSLPALSVSHPRDERRNLTGLLHPLASFVGREQEIGALTELLRSPEVRLLTLTGPGGIGKTRLALTIASELSQVYADGVVVVPLAALIDPAMVPATVAHFLAVPSAPEALLVEQLQSFLCDKHLLLVLDNFEHLLDAAPIVVKLLATSPGLMIFCTSRTRLGVSGEHLFPVSLLTPDASRQLFCERARAQVPAFVLTDDTTSVVGTICSRLDQLPLAIELAAARTAVLPPRALLNRLDHRLGLLTGGPRDVPERLQAMRAAIAWSHDLLSDIERDFFRRISVFVSGFTLEAAQAVGGMNALDGVSSLVASSLLGRVEGVDGEPRFIMLETIREYALEQLEASSEEQAIRRAHLRHFADMADRMAYATTGQEHAHIVKRLMSELGNIQVALAWSLREAAIAFGEFGDVCSTANSLEELASAVANDRPQVAARLMGAAESMREKTGQPRLAEVATYYGQTVAHLLATLDASFDDTWTAGRALSLEEVIAEVDAMGVAIDGLLSKSESRREPEHGLTPREGDVLRLLADGRSNRSIAEALSLSERTIEHHVLHIFTKLNVKSRVAAAAWTIRHGIA